MNWARAFLLFFGLAPTLVGGWDHTFAATNTLPSPKTSDNPYPPFDQLLKRFQAMTPEQRDQALLKMQLLSLDRSLEMSNVGSLALEMDLLSNLPKGVEALDVWLRDKAEAGATFWITAQLALRAFKSAESSPASLESTQASKLEAVRQATSMAAQLLVESERCVDKTLPQARWEEATGQGQIWDYAASLPEGTRRTIVSDIVLQELKLAQLRGNDPILCGSTQPQFVSDEVRERNQAASRQTLPDTLGALLRIPGARGTVPGIGPILLGSDLVRVELAAEIDNFVWSPDGKLVAILYEGGRHLALFDAQMGGRIWTRKLGAGRASNRALSFSSDGTLIFVGAGERGAPKLPGSTLTGISAANGQVTKTLISGDAIWAEAFALDGRHRRVLTIPGGYRNADRVIAFDEASGKADTLIILAQEGRPQPGKGLLPARLAVDTARDRLWWSQQGAVKLVQLSQGKQLREIQAFQMSVNAMTVNPRTGELVIGGTTAISEQPYPNEPKAGEKQRMLHFEDDVKTLVRVLDAHTGNQTRTYRSPGGSVESLSFSSDGRLLAAGRTSWTSSTGEILSPAGVAIWDPKTGKLLAWRSYEPSWVHAAVFEPDGHRVAIAVDKTLHIFGVER